MIKIRLGALVLAALVLTNSLGVLASAEEIIIKAGSAEFSTTGVWLSSSIRGYDNTSSLYSNDKGATATWIPSLVKGRYKISYYNISTNDHSVLFEVSHSGSSDYLKLDCTLESGWMELGVFECSGLGGEYVKLTKQSGAAAHTRANAMKFELTEQPLTTKAELEASMNRVSLGFSTNGGWDTTRLNGYSDASFVKVTNQAGAQAFWNPEMKEAGQYEVFIWCVPSKDTSVKFEVVHAGKTQTLHRDLSKEKKGWLSLGAFDFEGKGSEFVKVTKETLNLQTLIDCAKFESILDNKIYIVSDAGIKVTSREREEEFALKKQQRKQAEEEKRKNAFNEIPLGFHSSQGWAVSTLPSYRKDVPSKWTQQKGEMASYRPTFDKAGRYQIFIWKVDPNQSDDNGCRYEIYHNGKVDTARIQFERGKSDWFLLGEYDFAAEGLEYLKMIKDVDHILGHNTRADTVKFVGSDGTQILVDTNPIFTRILFSDLFDHWAQEDITSMAAKGFVKGVSQDFFSPDQNMTRAEFITLVTRFLELEEVFDNGFGDVLAGDWFAGSIGAAKQAGLLWGIPVSEDAILPDQEITRQEMATILYNAVTFLEKNTVVYDQKPTTAFADEESIHVWAKEGAKFCARAGIILGDKEKRFLPSKGGTRAEAAVMLKRFLEQVVYAGPPAEVKWELVFSDDFDGNELDTFVWQMEAGSPGHIMSGRWPENVVVENGMLKLLNKKQSRDGKQWTSGNVWTKTFEQKFGYFECRYRYAAASGCNNSFWLFSKSSGNEETRKVMPGLEIDVNEGHYPNMVNAHYFLHDIGQSTKVGHTGYLAKEDLSQDFHVYGLEWNEEEFIFYFDGKEICRLENASNNTPCAVLLSGAILTAAGSVTDALDGTSMDVDWVRVYQKK